MPQADTLAAFNKRLRQLLNLATSWSTFLKIRPIGWYREGEVGRVYTGKFLKKKS
jgi:hypothetical protein